MGAVGGPKWSATDAKLRPETGLLKLRRELGVYANLRPVAVHPALADSTTLKAEVVRGVDLLQFADGKITRKDSFWKILSV